MIKYLAIALLFASCGGSQGPAGAEGSKGDAGATGATGSSGITISSSLYCSKVSGGLLFIFRSVLYTSGDRWVSCYISDTSAAYSTSAVYKSTQSGATNSSCVLAYDLDAATSGYWTFTSSSGTNKTVYSDSGSASNNTTVTYSTSDCTTI